MGRGGDRQQDEQRGHQNEGRPSTPSAGRAARRSASARQKCRFAIWVDGIVFNPVAIIGKNYCDARGDEIGRRRRGATRKPSKMTRHIGPSPRRSTTDTCCGRRLDHFPPGELGGLALATSAGTCGRWAKLWNRDRQTHAESGGAKKVVSVRSAMQMERDDAQQNEAPGEIRLTPRRRKPWNRAAGMGGIVQSIA